MNNVHVSIALNTARLQATLNFLDSGAGNAAVQIYGSDMADTPEDAPSSAMLVQVELTKPCGTITDGVAALTQLADGMIATSGIATWARFVNGDGVAAVDCKAGSGPQDPESPYQVELTTTALYAGGDAQIVSAVLG